MALPRPVHVHLLFAGLLVVLGAALLALPRVGDDVVVAVATLVAVAVLLRVLTHRRLPDPMPWWLVLAALVVLAVHNLESLRWTAVLGEAVGSGPLSEVTLLLGYGFLLVAALLVVFRYARRDTGGVIEAVLVGLAGASLLWVLALTPALTRQGADDGVRLYQLVVLLLISGIAGGVIRAVLTSRDARGALVLLLVAVVSMLAGNTATVLAADASGHVPDWVGLLWLGGYLGLAAAAAHPSVAHLSTPDRRLTSRLTGGRLVFLGAVLALGPALAGVQTLRGNAIDTPLLLIVALLVVPLVMLRVAGLARLHAATEVELARLATRDELTGLPNRRAIDLHLISALHRLERGRVDGVLVLFLDLDDFKVVNDAHGHEVGDRLLATVAARVRGAVRELDVVARFGGDEFVVVVEGDPDTLREPTVRRIEDSLSTPVRLGEVTASARASIGVAEVRPGDGRTASQLLSAADAQMYERKRTVRAARAVDALPPDGAPVLHP